MLSEVREELNFTEQFDSLRDEYPKAVMEAIHEDVTFTLGSNPDIGEAIEIIPGHIYQVYKTKSIDGMPSFRVLYRYEDKQVILMSFIF